MFVGKEVIAAGLRSSRGFANKSQETVANAIGVNRLTYARWEDENVDSLPTIDKVCQLADYYGMTIDEVIGRTFTSKVEE